MGQNHTVVVDYKWITIHNRSKEQGQNIKCTTTLNISGPQTTAYVYTISNDSHLDKICSRGEGHFFIVFIVNSYMRLYDLLS